MSTSYLPGSLIVLNLDGDEYVSIDNGGSVDAKTTTAAIAALVGDNPEVFLTALTAAVALLPTTLPATSGVLWLNGGVLQLS
jgi:hypothetical protein